MTTRSLHEARAPRGRRLFSVLAFFAAAAGVIGASGEGGATVPAARRVYGAPQPLGTGQVRTYVLRDAGGVPVEIGVAMTEAAMDNLPAAPAPAKEHGEANRGAKDPHAVHASMAERLLELPQDHGRQFTFVELNWNPAGHEPPGVYDVPDVDSTSGTSRRPSATSSCRRTRSMSPTRATRRTARGGARSS
jgi:hypothetical protein